MGFQKMEKFDGEGAEDYANEKSDYFVVDMEKLANSTDKDHTANSRISLQRNLSRKGSQRCERKSSSDRDAIGSDSGGSVGVASGSPKGPCTPEKSAVIHMPIMQTVDTPSVNAQVQQLIQTNGESKFRRSNKQRSSWIDPWRILFVFATLSSIGSLILIYITLSTGKLNGDDNLPA